MNGKSNEIIGESSSPFRFSFFSFHSLKEEEERVSNATSSFDHLPSSPSLNQLGGEEILLVAFQEIVCYKTISSISECLVHSPHKIHQLYWTLQRRLVSQGKSFDFKENLEDFETDDREKADDLGGKSNRNASKRQYDNSILPWDERIRQHYKVQWKLYKEELIENQLKDNSSININSFITKIVNYHDSLFEGYQCWKERNNLNSPSGTCKQAFLINGESIDIHCFLAKLEMNTSLPPLLQSFAESDLTSSMISLLDPNKPCNYDDISWWSLFHSEEKDSPFDFARRIEKTFLEPVGLEVVFVMIKNMSGILQLQWIMFIFSLFLFRLYNSSFEFSMESNFNFLRTFLPADCFLTIALGGIEFYVINQHCNSIYKQTLPMTSLILRTILAFVSSVLWILGISFEFLLVVHWTLRISEIFFWMSSKRSEPLVKGKSRIIEKKEGILHKSCRNYIFLGFALLVGISLHLVILMPMLHSLDYHRTCSSQQSSYTSIFSYIIDIFTLTQTSQESNANNFHWICMIGHLGIVISMFMASILISGISFILSSSIFGLILGSNNKGGISLLGTTDLLFDLSENLKQISQYFFGRMIDDEEKENNSKILWKFYVDHLRAYDFVDDFEQAKLKGESTTIMIAPFSESAKENITFWRHSLSRGKYEGFPNWDEIPSVSTIIPCLNETIFSPSSSNSLYREIQHLKLVYPLEWKSFAQRIYKQFSIDPKIMENLSHSKVKEIKKKNVNLYFQLRLWASYRSQTVSRTIRGAHSYYDALRILRTTFFPSESPESRDAHIKTKFQLILAHQTFAYQDKKSREEILSLLNIYPYLEIVIPWEFEVNGPSKDMSSSDLHVSELTDELVERFGSSLSLLRHMDPRKRFASVCMREKQCGDSFVLSRRYPLLVGETQGKAANQRNALLFATKEIIQTLDSNQDAFAGECLKVPIVLKRFNKGKGLPANRIVGFTENIFTEQLSLVGKFHSRQEWSFSTISQRLYSFLGVRMHYGHPDFFDAGWVSSAGLSKASAKINLSEDIFAGFEVKMREESVCHVEEVCNFGKGRETNLTGVSKFETKISEGAASIFRSRDLFEMMTRLNLTEQYLVFHSSVGHFLTNSLLIHTIRCYLLSISLISFSCFLFGNNLSIQHFGTTALSLFGLGWISVLPLLFELILKYGMMEGLLKYLEDLPLSFLFHIFQAQTKHCAFSDSLYNGNASYRKTGRNLGNRHETLSEIYFSYSKSHFHPAFHSILFVVLLYSTLGSFNTIPLATLLLTAASFLFVPILFNPPSDEQSDFDELSSFWERWLSSRGTQLDDYWYQKEKQDFSVEVISKGTEKGEKHWTSGIIFHTVKTLLWVSLLWEGSLAFKTWMDLILPCWIIHVISTIFYPQSKQFRRGASSVMLILFALKGFYSIQLHGFHFAGTGLISSIMIFKGLLSSLRFIFLSLSAKKWRNNEIKFAENYHFYSVIMLTKAERWAEAAIWSSFAFLVHSIWSPFASLFLFGRSSEKIKLPKSE